MRQVEIVTDNNQDVIARIAISDNDYCEMDLSSYHALRNLGYQRLGYTESAGRKFVSFRDPVTTKHILVGRLLAGCKEGQICRYRDNNSLNLRLSNLRVV
ncbi:MAG TPA: hypothetical protein VGE97_02805 [Nitrososphaera sp.]|jgi:hypothetical protein